MPSSITVSHNNRKMTFSEDSHSYIDNHGKKYMSVTTLIGYAFEKFDAEKVAKALAEKRGEEDWCYYVNLWREEGTRLHLNCEHMILDRYDECYIAETPQEMINFSLAEKQVKKIKEDEHSVKFEPEKLVFSNILGLSVSIDILVKKDDGSYII